MKELKYLILICLISLISGKLERKNDVDSDYEIEDDYDDEMKEIDFEPLEDWQEIKPYHKVPAGLHYRINLETGLKEAKLVGNNDDDNTVSEIPNSDPEILKDSDTKREEALAATTKTIKSIVTKFAESRKKNSESQDNSQQIEKDKFKVLVNALKKIKNEIPEQDEETKEKENVETKKKFRSYDALKKELEGLNMKMDSDAEIIKRLVLEYLGAGLEVQLSIIEDLNYMLHQIDNGVDFVAMGYYEIAKREMASGSIILRNYLDDAGKLQRIDNKLCKMHEMLPIVIKLFYGNLRDATSRYFRNKLIYRGASGIKKIIEPGLNSTNEEIRKGVMTMIGSAAQSNPKVQIAAFEEGLLSQLLRIVAREKDATISSKAVFAVSCLVRGFPYGQKKLIEGGGLHTLREVFLKQDWQSLTLQLKVVSLIQDLLEERVNAEGERAKQFDKLNLMEALVDGEWCSAISSLLAGASFDKRGRREDLVAALSKEVPLRPDHDMVDKVVSAMSLLAPSCHESFFPVVPLLHSLRETYSDLAYKEKHQGEDGYEFFQDLANHIQTLLRKLSVKEEL